MSAIRLPYFEYPKTEESQANFLGWRCPVCREEDPVIFGGTVAHGAYAAGKVCIDGQKHPIHRYCLFTVLERFTCCTDCRVDIDASRVVPLWMKCRNAGLRLYNSFPALCERSQIWLTNPINQIYIGFACTILGFAVKKHPLKALGLGLQAIGINEAIEHGSQHIEVVRQIENLARDLISDIRKHHFTQFKLNKLKEVAAAHPAYYVQISAWVDSHEREKILDGLKNIQQVAKTNIFSDRIIRFWRAAALIGALYYTGKCLKNSPYAHRDGLFFEIIFAGLFARN